MKILKRSKVSVDYSSEKVISAVVSAMRDSKNIVDYDLALTIEDHVYKQLMMEEGECSVDFVSDIIQDNLFEYGMIDAGIKFITYRTEKNAERKFKKSYKFLSPSFLSRYKHQIPKFTELGNFVYYRTYSRFLPEFDRRETWFETVARVVDYNVGLAKWKSFNAAVTEAELMFDNMFNLRQFPSGRTMWSGGTETSITNPISQFNCAFAVYDNFDILKDITYLLMLGVGFGFSVEKQYVMDLPPVRNDIMVFHLEYEPVKRKRRKQVSDYVVDDSLITINVGDSKVGWAQAVDIFTKVFYSIDFKSIKGVHINYNSVRPEGEALKTFGGTASGPEALKTILQKLEGVFKKDNEGYKYLEPVDAMDTATIVAEGIVVGGVRRSAEMCLSSDGDSAMMNSKMDLYTQDEDNNWVENKKLLHRMMSNNSTAYWKKPTFETLKERINIIKHSAENNFLNMEAAIKRKSNAKGTNPCFTGDMRLLTSEGYKTFNELSGTEPNIINYNGEVVKSKVWSNGIKDTVVVKNSVGEVIKCTPDHRFMLTDGSECEAKDLKDKRVMPYYSVKKHENTTMLKYGFIQGDGQTTRLSSDTHKGLEVNIGKNDTDIFKLFNLPYMTDGRRVYLQGHNEKLRELGFSDEKLPNRTLPTTYNSWTLSEKSAFISGLYSANGSVIKKHRIALKSTSLGLIEEVKSTLFEDFGISSYITTNKSKTVSFNNGDYTCKESYDLNIGKSIDVIKFCEKISFIHEYKNRDLVDLILLKSPKIISVKQDSTEEVFDFFEPNYHWGVVEGYVAHNCGEILLDSNEFCNLVTLNAMSFVNEDGSLNREEMLQSQRLNARISYRVTLPELELPKWNATQKRDRLLGLSLTGWQDMVNATEMSVQDQIDLLVELREAGRSAADAYADSLGLNRSELVTTVKPEGTISQLPTVSSGVHMSHAPYYIRRVRINSNDPLCKAVEELGYPIFPEVGQEMETAKTKVIEFPVKAPEGKTKYDVSAIEQLETYKMFMHHYVDHNASNTISVRPDEWEDVTQWVWDNWDDIVGITFISLDDSFYRLLPYEACTEEEYYSRKEQITPFDSRLISKYEKNAYMDDLDDDDCVGGACPVR